MCLKTLSCLVCVLVEIKELYVAFYKKYLCITNLPEYWDKAKETVKTCEKKQTFAKVKIFWYIVSETIENYYMRNYFLNPFSLVGLFWL